MNKGIIFILGVVVGAVGGGFLAYRKLSINAEDMLNEEMEHMKEYYESRIQKLVKKSADENEEDEPAKELSKSSYEDYIKEHEDDEDENKVQYNNITKEIKEDKEEIQQGDYIYITKDQYEDENNGHDKATLFWFDTEKPDEKIVVNEDEDYYEHSRLQAAFRRTKAEKEDEDFDRFYCCDPDEMLDFKVILRTEEYYKGIVDDIWDEVEE